MQCVGLNDDANTYLLDILEYMNGRERSYEVFLLGLYRAIAIERFSNHQKIFIKMNEIFYSEKISNNLIDVFEDISKFYKALSDELPKRFKKETLEELIIHANEDDKWLYKSYMFYCKYSDIHKDIHKDIKLTYDYLFSDNKLISLFENQLNIVKDPCLVYSKRVLHVHLLAQLFYSLAAHLN